MSSLAALAAVSSAALASDRGDLRDSDTHFGKYSTKNKAKNYATDTEALIIVNGGKDNVADHGKESKL